jgi:hypothetical protein
VIYAFADETFIIFDRNKVITCAEYIGYCWAAGKSKDSLKVPTEKVKSKSCWHNMLLMELIKIADSPE